MRILHYQRDMRLRVGGVVRLVLDVAGAVAARGHEVIVAAPDVSELPREWAAGGADVPRGLQFPRPSRPLDLWGRSALREVRAALGGVDVVHIHGAWFPTNAQVAKQCRAMGVPYIITAHGMLDDWSTAQKPLKKKVYHAIAGRRMFEGAAALHVTTVGELRQTERWVRPKRAAVVPPVLDLEMFRVLPGAEEARAAFPAPIAGAPTVLFLSRVHPQKRAEVLIDAVAALKQRDVACNLFIAGPGDAGYVESLKHRAQERAVGDRVRLLGMVTGRLKASLYQMAGVFALPSPQESFGLVLTEAMSCGTPVVTTREIDVAPDLEASGAAVLAEGSAGAFAAAIETVLSDAGLRERLNEAAKRWLKEYLDPRLVAGKYEALYQSVRNR